MNFNKEIEKELKPLGLGGKVIPIAEKDKGTPEDWAKLEQEIFLETEQNREMMEKSLVYSNKNLII